MMFRHVGQKRLYVRRVDSGALSSSCKLDQRVAQVRTVYRFKAQAPFTGVVSKQFRGFEVVLFKS